MYAKHIYWVSQSSTEAAYPTLVFQKGYSSDFPKNLQWRGTTAQLNWSKTHGSIGDLIFLYRCSPVDLLHVLAKSFSRAPLCRLFYSYIHILSFCTYSFQLYKNWAFSQVFSKHFEEICRAPILNSTFQGIFLKKCSSKHRKITIICLSDFLQVCFIIS